MLAHRQTHKHRDIQTDRNTPLPYRGGVIKVENVAIDDVLPPKAARCDTIANLNSFWALRHKRPILDGFIYIHYAAPPYSARISAVYFLFFSKVWLGSVCRVNAWKRNTTEHLRRVGDNYGPILPVCGPKFTKFSDDVRDLLYFPSGMPNLRRVGKMAVQF